MSTTFPVMFDPTALTTASQTLYTVPEGANVLRNLHIKVANYTATARWVTVWNVISGGTAADANTSVKQYVVPINDYVLIPVCRLEAGGFIDAAAEADTALVASQHGGDLFTP